MHTYLLVAAGLLVAIGLVHSILGELLIVTPLLRQDLPKLLGTDSHTKRTIRAGWHLTSIAWWALAGVLIARVGGPFQLESTYIVAIAFLASALVTAIVTRGVVLSWAIFLAVGVLCWLSR